MRETSVMQQLRLRTRRYHDAVEGKSGISQLHEPHKALSVYKTLVAGNHCFHAYYEPAAFAVLPEWADRAKLAPLQADMKVLDLPVEEAKTADSLSRAQAWGFLYVSEGSMLGGSVIERELRKQEELEGVPVHFYGMRGKDTGKMWNSFKQALTQEVESGKVKEAEVVAGAVDAFKHFLEHCL